MKSRFFLMCAFVAIHTIVFGQRVVTGRVVDKETKKPIRDAKVTIIHSEIKTISNAGGFFQVTIDSLKDLLVEAADYEVIQITVPESGGFLIPMQKMEELTYTVVEQPAEFTGGMAAIKKYFDTNLTYPIDARKQDIEGTVWVSFVIDKNGEILSESVKVIRGIFPSCDDVAVRLVRAMPKWNPGMQNGKPVRSLFTLPINFKID